MKFGLKQWDGPSDGAKSALGGLERLGLPYVSTVGEGFRTNVRDQFRETFVETNGTALYIALGFGKVLVSNDARTWRIAADGIDNFPDPTDPMYEDALFIGSFLIGAFQGYVPIGNGQGVASLGLDIPDGWFGTVDTPPYPDPPGTPWGSDFPYLVLNQELETTRDGVNFSLTPRSYIFTDDGRNDWGAWHVLANTRSWGWGTQRDDKTWDKTDYMKWVEANPPPFGSTNTTFYVEANECPVYHRFDGTDWATIDLPKRELYGHAPPMIGRLGPSTLFAVVPTLLPFSTAVKDGYKPVPPAPGGRRDWVAPMCAASLDDGLTWDEVHTSYWDAQESLFAVSNFEQGFFINAIGYTNQWRFLRYAACRTDCLVMVAPYRYRRVTETVAGAGGLYEVDYEYHAGVFDGVSFSATATLPVQCRDYRLVNSCSIGKTAVFQFDAIHNFFAGPPYGELEDYVPQGDGHHHLWVTEDGFSFDERILPWESGYTGLVSAIDAKTLVVPVWDGAEYALYESENVGVSWTKRGILAEGYAAPPIEHPDGDTMRRFAFITQLRSKNGKNAPVTPGAPWITK